MANTEKLSKMLDDLINNKPEQAQVDFHEYLRGKMQEVVKGDHPDSEEKNPSKEL